MNYERTVGTEKKSLKQGVTSSEDLTKMLPEGRDSTLINQTKLTNLTYSLINCSKLQQTRIKLLNTIPKHRQILPLTGTPFSAQLLYTYSFIEGLEIVSELEQRKRAGVLRKASFMAALARSQCTVAWSYCDCRNHLQHK